MTNLYWYGDGGVHTSIDDFIYWDRQFYKPKLGRLPSDFITKMKTPNTKFSWMQADAGRKFYYANGQFLSLDKGKKGYFHSGSWLGFTSFYVRLEDDKFSVVTFCNNAVENPNSYANQIVEYYLSITAG